MALGHNPSIATSGLVLCLDAANPRSYPGSGTTWNDAMGSTVRGTLTNGPTYSSTNSGGLIFDGVDDYVELNTNNIITGTNPFTVECWYNLVSGNYGELFGNYGTGYTSNTLWVATLGFYISGSCYVPNYATATQGIHCVTCTRDSSGNCTTYLDGVSVATASLGGSIPASANFRMGADTNVNGGAGPEQLNGRIYNLKVYNVVLTAAQVLQNFNAMRGRFGI
jgi:hypothetical protein